MTGWLRSRCETWGITPSHPYGPIACPPDSTVDRLSALSLYRRFRVSVEIQAGFPCPHLVVEEPVVLGADRRSLQTRAPVANATSVRILVNNEVYIPASGLYSQALLQARSGPYRIERCTGVLGPD